MDQKLDLFFRDYFEKRRDDIIRDILELVSIRSVKGEAKPGAPVGEGPAAALDKMLEFCRREGFATKNIDNIVGEATYGEGEESLGVLAHLDVVPEGEGWDRPPYEPTFEDGILYGRGVADNKGACVISLYALCAFREAGIQPGRTIKLIFGTDEESGSACVKRYLQSEPAPTMAYSPDAGFPAIYAEKNIANVLLQVPVTGATALTALSAGTAPNVVPPTGTAALSAAKAAALPEGVALTPAGEGCTVLAAGTPAHASTPWVGNNSAVLLLKALAALLDTADAAYTPVNALLKLCGSWNGEGLNINKSDEVSGPLTMNLGMLKLEDGMLKAVLDLRLPVTLDPEELLATLIATAGEEGVAGQVISLSKGLYVPADSELVSNLMSVYHEINGTNEPPMAMGGGTYARLLPRAVAFGPGFPGEGNNCHMANEYQNYASLEKAGIIYAHVMARLAGK